MSDSHLQRIAKLYTGILLIVLGFNVGKDLNHHGHGLCLLEETHPYPSLCFLFNTTYTFIQISVHIYIFYSDYYEQIGARHFTRIYDHRGGTADIGV